jgi:PAS domain S-box-containing protein
MATLAAAGAVAIVYFLAARLGLALLTGPEDVAVFWPASGIAVGILITLGRRARMALVIGVIAATIAANLMGDRSFWTSLFKGFCNAGEAVFTAWLIERWFARPFAFDDLRHVLGFVAAGCLGVAAFAFPGAATMRLFHTTAPYWDVWSAWFLADAVGIVMVAPLVIEFGRFGRKLPSRAESIEGGSVLILLALIGLQAATHPTGSWLSFDPDAVVLPLLLWLVIRCQPVFGIAGAFLESITIVYATIFGIGHLGDASVPVTERVSGAQLVITMVTLYTLVLAALFTQRRESEAQLAKKGAALARLHEISSRLWLKRDLRHALDEILAGAIELLGADMGIIRTLDPARGVLKIAAHRGFEQEFIDSFCEVSAVIDSPCARTLRSGKRMVIADVEEDNLFTPLRSRARSAGVRAVQSTPILSRERAPLGTLTTHFQLVHKPAEQDLHLLDLYVRQAADIIERHNAEDALRESEERLRLTQLRTGVGIWDWDLRTGKLTWTPELEALFGLEPGSVKCYADFRGRVHPDDIAAIEAHRNAAVRRREPFTLEFRIIRADGQVRWILAMGGAFYDQATGDAIRILGNNVDITERKLTQLALAERNTQFELASKAARVGSFSVDFSTGVVKLTPGCAYIYGLDEGTIETSHDDVRKLVHPADLPQLEARRDQMFLAQQREFIAQFRINRADDGEIRWLEVRSLIFYDQVGRPSHLIGINIDVTERKQTEERQRALAAELDHRVKNALATISSVVSHTRHESGSFAGFVAALDGRIRSMATTHELLSLGRWQGISLTELIRRELAPYATRDNTKISGPEVTLRPEAGRAMAMVLHELVTNAAKYGALSSKVGHVVVRWEQRLNGAPCSRLLLEWQEIGGPPVVASGKPSYGVSTIRDLIPYEFGGSVDLVLASDGVRCRLELPADWLSKGGEPIAEANIFVCTGDSRT